MTKKPDVTVVVVSLNNEMHISRCLQSILDQDYPRDRIEIIVVDAGSEDKTQELARGFPVQLVVDTCGTPGHRRNQAVRLAKGRFVAFTEADCQVDSSWLSQQVAVLEQSPPDVAVVTGPSLVMDSDPPLARAIFYMQQTVMGCGGKPQRFPFMEELSPVMSAPNCNAVYRQEILLAYGYDDRLACGEDAEVNWRLIQDGYLLLYNPHAVVWHHRVSTAKALARKTFAWGCSIAEVTRKQRLQVQWYVYFTPFLLLNLVALPFLLVFEAPSWWLSGLVFYLFAVGEVVSQVYSEQRSIHALCVAYLLPLQHVSYGAGVICGLLNGIKW